MKRYFHLRCKQIARYMPGIFLATLVLLGSLVGIYQTMITRNARKEENQKFKIALVGDPDDPFLEMGLTALESFDSTRFSLDIYPMDLDQAKTGLITGKVAAYVVIPEDFVEEAMDGNILPLEFVSTPGATGLVSLFKDEVTLVIADILLQAQKGTYGMADALQSEGVPLDDHMDELAIDYAQQVFIRDQVYSLNELGIEAELGFADYLLCGFSVLFLLLCCLSFAPVMIPKDLALSKMLAAQGRAGWKQMLCNFAAYALLLFSLVGVFLIGISIAAHISLLTLFAHALPVVLMAVSFSFMLYSLSSDLIGGILLQFFSSLLLCFVSGCLYSVYFFPSSIQKAAQWLPTGLARNQLASIVTEEAALSQSLLLVGYSALFVAIGIFAGDCKLKEVAK